MSFIKKTTIEFYDKLLWVRGMTVILNEGEFLAKLKPGDVFWYLVSYCCKPTHIAGPFVVKSIKSFSHNSSDGKKVVVFTTPDGKTDEDQIDNLTNEWHGVFLTKEEGEAYLKERQHAYETDPVLIAEYERIRKEAIWDDTDDG